jgi:hypothetical protein
METELELGGFYTCNQDGFEPVVIWIGRVDEPDDLGRGAPEPVVSLILRGPEGTPGIALAPFWESVALAGEMTAADEFDIDQDGFDDSYNVWRTAFDDGAAEPWAMTPNEVHAQMMSEMEADEDAE